ncbi:macro domain-containing protein [Kitasatospora sp. NBC_01266]|uniref:macro domain-containing protein n=1 Tax=Kitasatospora sp. NBC_01266 TaxID=2903572 RepID=UPI002E316BC0|nr:macro domain-containing protein [Kitasatospora sp. NBC_01266]
MNSLAVPFLRIFWRCVGSWRWWRSLATNSTLAFGIVSGVVQLLLALWPNIEASRIVLFLSMVVSALAFGVVRAAPRREVSRSLGRPDVTVVVKVGDLFDESSHLIIGFNDTFDTDTSGDLVISRSSVQGQFLARIYSGDTGCLDAELSDALLGVEKKGREARSQKRAGKLTRYPVGSVAVLTRGARRYFCSAYGRMGNDLTVSSSVDDLWHSLANIWRAVEVFGRREPVAMPIIGSEMARIDHADREILIRMILLSFVSRSRERLISKRLTIVVHPNDANQLDMLEMDAFLKVL